VARKYYTNFYDINNAQWKVEIWDDPSGSGTGGTEIRGIANGFTIDYQGDGDAIWENPIRKGKAVLTIAVNNSTDETFFQSLSIADEQKYAMVVYKGSDLVWIGRIIPDQISWFRSPLQGNVIYKVTSIDGLSILENFKVDPTWFSAANRLNMLDLIRLCISKANLYQYWDYLGYGNNYINDCVQTYPLSGSRPIQFLKKWEVNLSSVVDDFKIYTEQTADFDAADVYVNCYDAIENILQKYGARILLYKGQYWITQPIAYGNGAYPVTFEYRVYSTAGAKTNSLNYGHRIFENTSIARSRFEAYPTITHQAAVSVFKTSYKRSALISNVRTFSNKSSSIFYVSDFTAPQGNDISVKATLKFGYLTWAGNTIPASSKVYVAFRIYSYTSGGGFKVYNYNNRNWTLASSAPNYESIECNILSVEQAGPTNAIVTTDFFRNFSADTGIDGVRVDFQIIGLQNAAIASGSSTNIDMWGDVNICQIDKTAKLNSVGNKNNASKVVEFDTRYYQNNQSIFDSGAIYDLNSNSLPDGWRNVTGKYEPYITASSSDFMALYSRAVRVAQGNWIDAGNYTPTKSLIFDNGIYIFNGGSFDAMACQWDGEWLRMSNYPDDVDNATNTDDATYNDNTGDSLIRIFQQINEQKVSTQNIFEALPYRLLQVAENPVTTTPTIDTRWAINVLFDDSSQKNFISLNELGSLVTLTSGTYTASVDNPSMLCNTTEGNITINLPAANTSKGVEFWFKKTSTSHVVRINGTIDAMDHTDLNNLHESIVIVSDGSGYWIKTHY
jgi:hypothetical protein